MPSSSPPPHDDVWLIKTEDTPLSNVPSVRLLYSFDDDSVTFVSIKVE